MSTYLVAFVIGEYSVVEDENKIGLDIKVYTPLNQQYLGIFAHEIAKKSVVYFEEFYGIKYPLPKLDLIAVPENPIEAMENYSLIIFNQPNLLLNIENCTNFGKIMVAYVITHEIAHQWFGNLVTMVSIS
jgi:aminopeptidase N